MTTARKELLEAFEKTLPGTKRAPVKPSPCVHHESADKILLAMFVGFAAGVFWTALILRMLG